MSRAPHQTKTKPTAKGGSAGYLALAAAAVALALSACMAPAQQPPAATPATQGSASSSATAPATGTPAPSQTGLDPATAQLKATLESTLVSLAAANPKPGQDQLRTALLAAGIPAGTLEVSVSRTPTGLDVDAIEAATPSGRNCVVGQVRDGAVAVTVLPVLASGKCFVGDSR
ncbi:DUF6993 domain-containing protein [Arthrobacter sp. CJ23]|uniref:DUF6993 domain-containing protein n=1 Tax=Arthrobacter sp. CJ23 TaxID=2972479 RepID=UPI00215C61F7|nr:hypothetical protein [Arthrobacter sp. CJ23]UVJ37971.1 hypothetical protein NVV90_11910 [Arthrobacter sp. CJ23]